jgi:ABC-2 type transport system permease protein
MRGILVLMRAYIEYAKKSFMNNIAFRGEYFATLINVLVSLFVNIAIWKAIYEEGEVLEGVGLGIIVTYVIFGVVLQSIFTMEEYLIERKVKSGIIATDLLKPISFRMSVFSYNLGGMVYRLIMLLIPAFLISIMFIGIYPPFSSFMAASFLLSVILGYIVLYNLNFIVWVSSFWFYRTFSLVTIKDTLVSILSGAVIPLWFLPQQLVDFIKMTPFESIYYTPITIYLGQIPPGDVGNSIFKQLAWVLVLGAVGNVLWKIAKKKLVVQGG